MKVEACAMVKLGRGANIPESAPMLNSFAVSQRIRSHVQLASIILLASCFAVGCGKKKDDDTDNESISNGIFSGGGAAGTPTADVSSPGTLMLTLDASMGSLDLEADSNPLRMTSSWVEDHCDADKTVKEAYQSDEAVSWGCKMRMATNGPDTPRGALARLKAITCSIDPAIEDGSLKFDETEVKVPVALMPPCWTEEFAQMVIEEMPDKVDATLGYVVLDIPMTGYATVPDSLGDASVWDAALEVRFGAATEGDKTYTMLMKITDDEIAAAILDKETGKGEAAFALGMKFLGGAEDLAELRYEGRFPFGKSGDGGYGSRHLRLLAEGPYAGDGAFSGLNAATAFEAECYGNDNGEVQNCGLAILAANADGMATRKYELSATGVVSATPASTWSGATGTTAPTLLTYAATAAEKATFMTEGFGTYKQSADWHKSSAPLSFKAVELTAE